MAERRPIVLIDGCKVLLPAGDTLPGGAASDPFAKALFDECTPLFDKDEFGNVTLLEEC